MLTFGSLLLSSQLFLVNSEQLVHYIVSGFERRTSKMYEGFYNASLVTKLTRVRD